jgi:hypothetical protein
MDAKAVASFAKALVAAKAIKPAVGIFAIFLSLVATEVANQFCSSSQLLFWIPTLIAGALGASGAWAICAFLFYPASSIQSSQIRR